MSCASCHGDVGEMVVVHHEESHSMRWCLDCHKNPEKHLRPLDEVFNLKWKPEDLAVEDFKSYISDRFGDDKQDVLMDKLAGKEELTQEIIGTTLKDLWHIRPPSGNNCSGCHR